jgi:hypothetical protein
VLGEQAGKQERLAFLGCKTLLIGYFGCDGQTVNEVDFLLHCQVVQVLALSPWVKKE